MTNYRRKKNPPRDLGKKFNVNNQIIAKEVRVLDHEGGMLGVFPLHEALRIAQEKELDIIEINPKAQPPVVKMMDFYKFKYQQAKSEAAKPKKKDEIKTLRVSVRVSINDLQVRANKIKEFITKEFRVKMQVQMKGREKAHPEVAEETMKLFISLIDPECYIWESEPKLMGDSVYATIKPKK